MVMRAARARSRRRRTVRILRWLALLVLGYYALCTLGLLYLRFLPPLITMVQLQQRLESLGDPGRTPMRYTYVPRRRISNHLAHAVVAAEDARFYRHHGIDWEGVRDAMEDNLERGRVWRGGSTITQQLVKNLFLGTYGSVLRKAVEAPLALLAEVVLTKNRILELYLNVVEWGPAVYGAEAASRHHYGIPASALNREQSARLAACLPAPRSRTPQRMDRYSRIILKRMAAMGW
jgi:monofunctional biosynthetic peptidoglycan transglycosylase